MDHAGDCTLDFIKKFVRWGDQLKDECIDNRPEWLKKIVGKVELVVFVAVVDTERGDKAMRYHRSG